MQTSGLPTGGGLFKPTGIMSGAGSSLEGEADEKAKLKKEIRWPIPASELPQRSMLLVQSAKDLLARPGIMAEPTQTVNIENEGQEFLYVYHTPEGDLREVFVSGFALGLADGTGNIVAGLIPPTQAPPLQSN